jgi:hypothetical protein
MEGTFAAMAREDMRFAQTLLEIGVHLDAMGSDEERCACMAAVCASRGLYDEAARFIGYAAAHRGTKNGEPRWHIIAAVLPPDGPLAAPEG